jgi:chromosome segregation ATPase
MEVNLNTTSAVRPFAAVAEAVQRGEVTAPAVATPLLAGEGVTVSAATVDLDELLAQMRMETNEARLNAARSRLSSALDQLTGPSEEQQANVNALKQTGEALNVAEREANAAEGTYTQRQREVESAQKTLDRAEKALDKAEAKVKDAEASLQAAEDALAAYLAAGSAGVSPTEEAGTAGDVGTEGPVEGPTEPSVTVDPEKVAELEQAVADAQAAVSAAKAGVVTAKATVSTAQTKLDAAVNSAQAAKTALDAAEATVAQLQETFDAQLRGLDSTSQQALREALQVSADDLDHLHEEIEEEDKEHSLATVRSVEDVIADSLKRMDGEMVDEVESRHLDHI